MIQKLQRNNNHNNNSTQGKTTNKNLSYRRRTISTVTPQSRPEKQLLNNNKNAVEFSTLEASLAFNCKSNNERVKRNVNSKHQPPKHSQTF